MISPRSRLNVDINKFFEVSFVGQPTRTPNNRKYCPLGEGFVPSLRGETACRERLPRGPGSWRGASRPWWVTVHPLTVEVLPAP
uniref:Uncharacterized protein n=1 Tax=Gossypium raimondii TaxID=29730 RepID=A0A0D2RDL3_GOSRA|nr:hypothetical protein B456_003G170800 [Gossypium raimondii]